MGPPNRRMLQVTYRIRHVLSLRCSKPIHLSTLSNYQLINQTDSISTTPIARKPTTVHSLTITNMKGVLLILGILFIGFYYPSKAQDDIGVYKIGTGISDITGPPAGVPLNGYIGWELAEGIYTRQYARAFVVQSISTEDVIAYVTTDMGMIDHSIVAEVVARLQGRYGNKFSQKNVMISATHTHSGVSGFMTYYAFLLIESKGFNPHSFWSAVDGIFEAISTAYDSSVPGRLSWASSQLNNTIRNRRPQQYDRNPDWERALYDSNTDNFFTIIKLEALDSTPIGLFTWFPVHPQDFNPSGRNPIVSSDHAGYTALLFDEFMNGPDVRPGKGAFVTGIGSANLGDCVTDWTDYEPEPGPLPDPWVDHAPYIRRASYSGKKQFQKALELFVDTANLTPISGRIQSTHQFIDVNTIQVPYTNETSGETETVGLCQGAMGVVYFSELDPEGELWEIIRDVVHPPSEEMVKCQEPKGVIIAAGEMFEPWAWGPAIFSIQLFQIGNVQLAGLPGEFTTMSGRRVRRVIESMSGGQKVILAGLTNNYINYITTPEEYDGQSFEGGATIYGRNTIPVVTHLFGEMARALVEGDPSQIPEGPTPPSFLDLVRNDVPTRLDSHPDNLFFGDVLQDVADVYDRSSQTEVRVVFVAGSPRNSSLRKGTFLVVEKEQDGGWKLWRTDADLDTVFHWGGRDKREARITWYINPTTDTGKYRIRHFGYYLMIANAPLQTYSGMSKEFIIQ